MKRQSENREEELLAELKASEAKIDKLKESFDLDGMKDELPIITREEQKRASKKSRRILNSLN